MSVLLQLSSVVGSDGVREICATAGIDLLSVSPTPIGEGVGIDIRLDDDFALRETTFAKLFSLLLPLLESCGEGASVDEQGFQSLVIRFAIPSQTENSDGVI